MLKIFIKGIYVLVVNGLINESQILCLRLSDFFLLHLCVEQEWKIVPLEQDGDNNWQQSLYINNIVLWYIGSDDCKCCIKVYSHDDSTDVLLLIRQCINCTKQFIKWHFG